MMATLMAPGAAELLLIVLVLFVLFGSKDAPRHMRSIMKMINRTRRAVDRFQQQLMCADMHRPHEEDNHVSED